MLALIADDEATNRLVLKRLLTKWGYQVVVADNGRKAWEVLSTPDAPRLAVLDWLMPGLDGVDICRMLSQRPAGGRYTYTVLVSHKASMEEMALALDAGADDFIAKPVNPVELRSRLGVAKRMLAYGDRVEESNRLLKVYATEMQQLAEERASQLVHADRMATLGMLAAGVAHEVNNPTTFISGNIQTIERFWMDLRGALDPASLDEELARKVSFILEEMPNAIAGIHNGVKRISKIVQGLKDYSRHKPGERGPCEANECARRAVELVQFQTGKANLRVELDLLEGEALFLGDAQQMEQVLVNLVVNATHALEGHESPAIRVWTRRQGNEVVMGVTDNGKGVPEDLLERIWNPFFTTKAAGVGTGLGLSICRRIADDHGGRLTVENVASGGAEFTLSVPAAAEGVAA